MSPDISMCKGEYCHIKDNCYRYRAVPTEGRQSYFIDSPHLDESSCKHYWPIDNKPEGHYPLAIGRKQP